MSLETGGEIPKEAQEWKEPKINKDEYQRFKEKSQKREDEFDNSPEGQKSFNEFTERIKSTPPEQLEAELDYAEGRSRPKLTDALREEIGRRKHGYPGESNLDRRRRETLQKWEKSRKEESY